MATNNLSIDLVLDQILKFVENGDFHIGCNDLKINEYYAVGALLKKYPNRREELIRRIISETDPIYLEDIHIGNYEVKSDIIDAIDSIETFNDGEKNLSLRNHVVIYGDAGVGKTSFLKKLKKYYNVIDYNASNQRTFEDIAADFQNASMTDSLVGLPRIIFFDEVDSMSRSGYDFIYKLIGPGKKEMLEMVEKSKKIKPTKAETNFIQKTRSDFYHRSKFPVIMACNDIKKVSDRIKKNDRVRLLEFLSPEPYEIETLLDLYSNQYFIDDNKIKISKNEVQIQQISNNCNGDVRLAKMMLLGGEKYDDSRFLRPIEITYIIFTLDDRDYVYRSLIEMPFSFSTILNYLAVNVIKYYDKMIDIKKAIDLLSEIDPLKFQIRKEFMCSCIAYTMPVSRFKGAEPMYPQSKQNSVMKNGQKE